MLDDDDKLFAFYNSELIALSSRVDLPRRLHNPPFTAHAVSPICGSEIDVDLVVDQGRITAFGYDVEACALTKAVVAVMETAIIGKAKEDVAQAGETLARMLDGEDVLPVGDWEKLSILQPVKDYKARHNSILLPFEAVKKALG